MSMSTAVVVTVVEFILTPAPVTVVTDKWNNVYSHSLYMDKRWMSVFV